MAISQSTKSANFTAANQEIVAAPGNLVDVMIQGTFAGTIQLQRRIGGVWFVIQSWTAVAFASFRFAVSLETRLVMTAFTSGTANVALSTAESY